MRPVRFHFVGTNYATGNMVRELVMPLARELSVERFVDEHPGRVPYLEALQITAGFGGPARARFDILTLQRVQTLPLHPCEPAVAANLSCSKQRGPNPCGDKGGSRNRIWRCRLFRQGAAGGGKTPEGTPQVSAGCTPATDWKAFERYTSRSVCAGLAAVFEQAILEYPSNS